MHKLIELLADGAFHSGESIGRRLGISRAAVWKQLRQLENEYSVAVQRVPGKGYRLDFAYEALSKEKIEAAQPYKTYVLNVVDSTNAEVLRRLSRGMSPEFWLLAECQTSGRGRRGRSWFSPYGQCLYVSLAIAIEHPKILQGLSLVIGLAICRVLHAYGVSGVGVKWPNDILVNGKKIAGVLVELIGDPSDQSFAVIGVGLNVNMQRGAADIDLPWTSLRLEQGRFFDRNELSGALGRELSKCLKDLAAFDFSYFKNEWESLHAWAGREVCLISARGQILGCVLGVTSGGELRLNVDGMERVFNGGELHLRLQNDS